jgi:hypothetical protein
VAEELRAGLVRVELSLTSPGAASVREGPPEAIPDAFAPGIPSFALIRPEGAVPLQHGLPGRVEVEVESVTPAQIILRWVGALTVPPATGPGAGPASP